MRYGWQAQSVQGGRPQKGCLVNFTRSAFLTGSAMLFTLAAAAPANAQDLQDRQATPPPPVETPLPTDPDQVQFSSGTLEYDRPLEAGMVMASELFLTHPGVGSAGFEQNMIVTSDGCELLTRTPMLLE